MKQHYREQGCTDIMSYEPYENVNTEWNVIIVYIGSTVVWEKFDAKNFSSLAWHDKNWTHEIFLTINKK